MSSTSQVGTIAWTDLTVSDAVANLDQSVMRCAKLGGEVVVEPRRMGGHGKYCVIRDRAGAVIALFEKTA